jgi:hypothetical protein
MRVVNDSVTTTKVHKNNIEGAVGCSEKNVIVTTVGQLDDIDPDNNAVISWIKFVDNYMPITKTTPHVDRKLTNFVTTYLYGDMPEFCAIINVNDINDYSVSVPSNTFHHMTFTVKKHTETYVTDFIDYHKNKCKCRSAQELVLSFLHQRDTCVIRKKFKMGVKRTHKIYDVIINTVSDAVTSSDDIYRDDHNDVVVHHYK